MLPQPEHKELYKDLCELLKKFSDKLTSEEVLAIAANMLGKIVALQDQRTMTREKALKIIIANLELGNQQVIAELSNTKGNS